MPADLPDHLPDHLPADLPDDLAPDLAADLATGPPADLAAGLAGPGLRRLAGHDALLAASGGHPFVRYDVPATFSGPAFALGRAVAFVRQTQTGRRLLAVLGDGDDLDRLLRAVATGRLVERLGLSVISVPQALVSLLHRHFEVGDGGDWDWMWTTARPGPTPGESRIMALDEADLPEIRSLLQVANPTTHARPGERDEQWIGVREALGPLVACAAMERNAAGWPHLSGISVHPRYRGTGLGLALTANLTRQGVDGDGVCTLGMFSDNRAARGVYHGLGYRTAQAWASRPLLDARPTA